jgi:amino acid adenylation domain-containing protein
VDVSAPADRCAFITTDCAVGVVFAERSLVGRWQEHAERMGPLPVVLELNDVGGGHGLVAALDRCGADTASRPGGNHPTGPDDLAYVLYTSGSTGTPKGVMLTHASAVDHVGWCSDALAPDANDRFSSHAPFHFDLSILDLYVPLRHAATVVLINTEQGREPIGLARLIADRRLTIWYSTPTILTMLAELGRMSRHDYSALRYVLFAGEVFPIKHLRRVKELLPRPRFFNLYGPTETNVCTWHEIPDVIEADRTQPYPIGRPCRHFASRVVDDAGGDVARGQEGELLIHGRGMLTGYFNDAERTAGCFVIGEDGRRWYRTGDRVVQDADGVFTFIGRRDRMVKRRGYRIELGDVEAGLYRHPRVKEAAVVALRDADGGIRIGACLVFSDGRKPSEIELRRFCTETLPSYMIPDTFRVLDALPKTSSDKIDYVRLAQSN